MRNVMKAATLESKFPLLAVENGCIVSKEADVTVAFRVELPELFSVTGSEYEAVHSAWHKAVKVLPEYSIVHKQDFFIEEKYRPETDRDDLSFLSRSFERHFIDRPFLCLWSMPETAAYNVYHPFIAFHAGFIMSYGI